MKVLKIALVLSALMYLLNTTADLIQVNNSETGKNDLTFSDSKNEKMEDKTVLSEKKENEKKSHNFSEEEKNLLCKIAMAEAGNQDTEGKALVMLVVLNRVKEGGWFPNTIKEVIYQPSQFSPVLEGKFEKTIPNEDCFVALKLVEDGWDESKGALYFESESASTWHHDNLRLLFKHQDHNFYTERNRK